MREARGHARWAGFDRAGRSLSDYTTTSSSTSAPSLYARQADITSSPDGAKATSGAGCITCPASNPVCNCSAGQQCVLTARTCNTCQSIQCLADPSSSNGGSGSGGSGSEAGVIVGPVVAGVALIVLSAFIFWWLRRRKSRGLARLEAMSAAAAENRRTMKAQSAQQRQKEYIENGKSPLGSPLSGSNGLMAKGDVPLPRPDVPDGVSERFPRDVRPSVDGLSFAAAPTSGDGRRILYDGSADINVDPARMLRDRRTGNPFDDARSIATDQMSFGSTNVIPIAYVPSPNAMGGVSAPGDAAGNTAATAAAARLEAARNAAIGQGTLLPPTRPPRSPDLDLRLRPEDAQANVDNAQSGTTHARNSAYTGRTHYSLAPSFFSGQSEFAALGYDGPQIVTSQQVHLGVRQAAEVVNLRVPPGPSSLAMQRQASDSTIGTMRSGDPFSDRYAGDQGGGSQISHVTGETGASDATFGNAGGSSIHTGQATYQASTRSLTPSFFDGDHSSPRSADFRLRDTRDSVSTMGTHVVVGEARRVDLTTGLPLIQRAPPVPPLDPSHRDSARASATSSAHGMGQRESIMSSKSAADSFLSGFPFLPPSNSTMPRHLSNSQGSGTMMPTSMSSTTLDAAAFSRNDAGAQMADAAREEAEKRAQRQTMASVASEGLGAFDFQFGSGSAGSDVPPLPDQRNFDDADDENERR